MNGVMEKDEHRFDRASWLALGFVLLIAVISVIATVAALMSVGDGCKLDPDTSTVVDTCLGGWSTPLRPGDEIIAVNGAAWSEDIAIQQPQVPPGWVDGGTARYTIKRGDAMLDLNVPLHLMGWDDILRAFGYGLVQQALGWNTIALIGALVIFTLRPRTRAAQLLLIAIGGLNAAVVLTSPNSSVGTNYAPASLWLVILFFNLSWAWLFVPTILLFVLSFPRRVWPLAYWQRLTQALIYGLPLAAIAASIMTTNVVFYLAALGLGALCVVGATITITAHTFLRVRDPVVRAQSAWLAFGLAVGLAYFPLLFVLGFVFPGLQSAMDRLPWWLELPMNLLPTLAFPICLGIAITRYRLFDIEIIIRRTLVYTLLTLTLGTIYIVTVIALQALFRQLTGQESTLAVVASTLAIAALFQLVRRRMQNLIDQRFYRKKYNAQQVLAAFAQRIQTEAELKTIAADMIGVVQDTLQPESVQLWLREVPTDKV